MLAYLHPAAQGHVSSTCTSGIKTYMWKKSLDVYTLKSPTYRITVKVVCYLHEPLACYIVHPNRNVCVRCWIQ